MPLLLFSVRVMQGLVRAEAGGMVRMAEDTQPAVAWRWEGVSPRSGLEDQLVFIKLIYLII